MNFRRWTKYFLVLLLFGIFVQQSYGYIPSRQAKFITFSNVNSDEMKINWVRGNGQGVIVLMKASANPDVSSLGEDENTATHNTAFNLAPDYPASSGNKLVYSGNGNSVTVTGLTQSTTYHVMVLEYNVDGSMWDINNGEGALNPRSKTTLAGQLGLPGDLTTIALTKTTATVQWLSDGNNATGYYIDVRLNNGAILENYDLLDIGLPTSKKFYINGLTQNTGYQWRLRPYDAQGRAGAPTSWYPFTTLQVDPTVSISGASSSCGAYSTLIATWHLGTSSGASYYPSPASGTWTTLVSPTGASQPNIIPNNGLGSSTGSVTVDKAGAYVFQYEISVGEYYYSTTAGYTFKAPDAEISTIAASTCGTYYALNATTTGCNPGTGTWSYTGPIGGTGSFNNSTSTGAIFSLTGTPVYGNYTFRWTSTYQGLSDYDEVVISFDEAATASITGSTADASCGLTYNLDGNTPAQGATSSWWQVSGPGTASFGDVSSNTSSVTVNQEGFYSFAWSVSNGCNNAVVGKHVTFYAAPDLSNAGTDDEECGLTYTLNGNNPTAGIGTWTGPAGVSFSNTSTYNSTVTVPSFSGNYTYHSFTWTIGNGNCSGDYDDVTVTFYNSPVASVTTTAGTNCGLSIANLDGNNPTIGSGSWSIAPNYTGAPNSQANTYNPGSVSFGDPTAYNSSVDVSVEGAYKFVWTVSNGTCTPAEAVKFVTFYAEPDVANAGQDADNCGLTYSLTGNNPTSGTGSWSQVAGIGTSSFSAANSWSSNVTIPTFGTDNTTYTFRWTVSNGTCTPNYDDVVVTFYNQPSTASAGTDVDVCGSLTWSLDGNLPTYGDGSWSLVSGAGNVTFDDETYFASDIDVDAYGEYTFRWTVENGTCTPSTDDVVFNFYEDVIAQAGDDIAVCGTTHTFSANANTPGTGTWSGPNGITFNNENSATADVTIPNFNGASTYYTFTWSVSNGPCDVEYDEITVTFKQTPIANAGTDGEACEDVAYTMTATLGSFETGTWTHTYTGVTFSNVNSPTSTVTIATPGTYEFSWTTDNGTCEDTDVVSIEVFESIIPVAGNDFAVCGLVANLGATEPSAGTGTWSGTGVQFSNVNAYNAQATASATGVYTLTWAVSNGPCATQFDEVTVTFKPELQPYAGADAIGCTGVSNYYTMTATYASGETGSWSQSPNNPGTATFSSITANNSQVVFNTPGSYSFSWTVSNGTCEASDNVTINVYNPIEIPLGASISGDDTPAAGSSNIEYSIPNYNDDLTYSWYYTTSGTCGTNGTSPIIKNNGNNIVYLDYALTACDGTLSVNLVDNCNKVSTYHLPIDVQSYPVILSSALDQSNASINVTMNTPVFTDCSTNVVTPADFQLFFTMNGGTATGVSIDAVTRVGVSNVYKFDLIVSGGLPNGCETIEIKPVNNAVFNENCSAMPSDQTTGKISLWNKQTIDAASEIDVVAYAKQATIVWTAPLGAKSLVVVNQTGTFNDPANYTTYLSNNNYGTQTYSPGNGYTVHNGSDNFVTVYGLSDDTTYNVAIWTYTETCGNNNEFFNMTQTTATFGTKILATKLVAITPPTKIQSGVPFNLVVQAQDASGNPAYPGCDETLYLTGSAALSTTTLSLSSTTATFGNAVYNDEDGDCDHVFTIDDDATCNYSLTAGTFTAGVVPTEPSSHAKTLIFSNTQKDQITVRWINGTGTGRILAVRKGLQVSLEDFIDGLNFESVGSNTTATFGVGKKVKDEATPAWALYRTTGTTSTVTVTGLEASTSYSFRVVEYNKPSCDTDWSLSNYKNNATGLSMNPRSQATKSAKLGSFNGVEIAYFDGKSYQLQVDLNWEAITEDGIAYYDIYRQDMYSEDMIKVGTVNVGVSAGGSTKYTTTDNKGLTLGETYVYRLVAVDFNGQSNSLAETLVTVNDDMNANVNLTLGTVNPNPVKDVVRFDVSTTQLSPVYIEIRNLEGQVIFSEERMINGLSTVEYKMNVKAAGTYYITVTSGLEGAVTTFIYQP